MKGNFGKSPSRREFPAKVSISPVGALTSPTERPSDPGKPRATSGGDRSVPEPFPVPVEAGAGPLLPPNRGEGF